MARAIFNKPSLTLRGILGGLICHQDKNDTLPVSRTADSSKQKSSTSHASQQRNSRTASTYRKGTVLPHSVYEELARATNKSAYSIALSDRMVPPVIHRILLRGDSIVIQASDNVMVAKVEVQVLGERGEVLERGDAVRLKADWWEYIPSYAGVKITAAAWDLAGNVTKAEM